MRALSRWLATACCSTALAPSLALAQAVGKLTGTVQIDRAGPLGGAEVFVQRTARRTTSGPDGRFALDSVPVGLQVLVVRRIGYRAEAISVAVDTGARSLGIIVLDPAVVHLEELTVTARYAKPERYANTTKYDDFYRRRRIGGGIFLDRDQLDQRFYMYTHQLLLGLPGVHVEMNAPGTGSKVWFSRCNESPPAIALFIDGIREIPPWGTSRGYGVGSVKRTADRGTQSDTAFDDRARFVEDMLNSISPTEIEAIEIFKGPGELPAEFNNGDNCGAIVIWTRQAGHRAVQEGRRTGNR